MSETHWLVLIDHHSAQLIRVELHATRPLEILPHAKSEYFRHAPHAKDFSRGQEKPEANSFFGPIADALSSGGEILLFGRGTGAGSEMELFSAWLKSHRGAVSARVVGSVVVDASHMTDGELLAKARDFYTRRGAHLV